MTAKKSAKTLHAFFAGYAAPPRPWEHLPDEELLGWRIRDLKLRIEGSALERFVRKLYEELDERGIRFHPRCYLTTEWLAPDKVPLIGVPFCLAHPRLYRLEKAMMLEVEGGTETTCMQLMRHEAGHALNYAFKLYRRTRWRELFGPFSAEYNVAEYYPRPYSRRFVTHLPGNYAQAHPDEDFAETFAVWLNPQIDWRKKYKGWGALQKLQYVDHLFARAGSEPPIVSSGEPLWPVQRVRSTLGTYYRKKREEFGDTYPGYYDPDLNRIFAAEGDNGREAARTFLSRHRKHLVDSVARWTRCRKYAVDEVVRQMRDRARELRLRLRHDEHATLHELGICLTALICERRQRQDALNKE